MKLEITDHRKIYAVQKEFSEMYPFLKIEFYAKPHTSGGAASEKIISHSAKTLGSCRTIHKKGPLNITPNTSIRQLYQVFNDVYGLTIKVSRRDGNNWLDTAETEEWSLEKQNNEGGQSMTLQPTAR